MNAKSRRLASLAQLEFSREPPPKVPLPPKLAEALGVRDAPAANGTRGLEAQPPALRGSVYTTQLTAGQKQQGGAYGEV